MNIIWLPGLTGAPTCNSAMWRQDYEKWISEHPSRATFSEFPTSTIYACKKCGEVAEVNGVGAPPCSHGGPLFVTFGEHERNAVEDAVMAWRNKWKRK